MIINAEQAKILAAVTTIRRRIWLVLPAEEAAAAVRCLAQGWRMSFFVGLRGALEAIERKLAGMEGAEDLYILSRDTALRCPVA